MHNIGDPVYLVTDVSQKLRMVTAYTVRGKNHKVYELSCGTETSWHTSIEITAEKDVLKTF